MANSLRQTVEIALTSTRWLNADPITGMHLLIKRFLRTRFTDHSARGSSQEVIDALEKLWFDLFPEDGK